MNNLRWSKAPYYLLLPVMAALLAGCGKKPVAEPPVRAVRTLVLAETGGVLEREFAAEIRARTESRLGFRVGGKVNRRLVELGQSVTRGQVLAQLDPQDLQLGQEAARAGLAAAAATSRTVTGNQSWLPQRRALSAPGLPIRPRTVAPMSSGTENTASRGPSCASVSTGMPAPTTMPGSKSTPVMTPGASAVSAA